MNIEWKKAVLMLGVLLALGCELHQPISIRTRLTQGIAPALDTSSIVEMPVGKKVHGGIKVGIIDIHGLMVNANRTGPMSLGGNPVADFRAKLDYARRHRDIAALVIRVNSPGGAVSACDVMREDLKRFQQDTGRPVVVSLLDVGTSGAYYLATTGDLIVAHPTTITGGIGVVFNQYQMSGMAEKNDLLCEPIRAGKAIDVGSPFYKADASLLTTKEFEQRMEEGGQILNRIATQFQQQFHQRIEEGRGIQLSGKEEYLDGRILTASTALEAGLVDSIGYLDDALRIAASQVSCSAAPVAVLLHRCADRGDTPYAITPADPLQHDLFPIDIPGLSREELPLFLYLWQPNPTYAR